MTTPNPNYSLSTGHPVYILFTGPRTIKHSLKDYGLLFDGEVADDTVHCILVDPRYSTSEVAAYIVELGGEIYVRVEPPPTL